MDLLQGENSFPPCHVKRGEVSYSIPNRALDLNSSPVEEMIGRSNMQDCSETVVGPIESTKKDLGNTSTIPIFSHSDHSLETPKVTKKIRNWRRRARSASLTENCNLDS